MANWAHVKKTKQNKTKQPKMEPISPFCIWASHIHCTLQRSLDWTACLWAELPACTVFLPFERALKRRSRILFQWIEQKPFHPIRAAQLQPIRVALVWPIRQHLLDQLNSKDLESSFTWRWTNQVPGVKTSIHIIELPCGSEDTLYLFTEDSFSQLPRHSCLSRAEVSS